MSNITSASGEASVSSDNMGEDNTLQQQQQQQQQQLCITVSGNNTSNNVTQQSTVKRKRNLPGTPDPEAEVIALSPRTLMATNRFICEICNKGFQRDQNLQLHRRGHNLPWKLRQRTSTEIRKRVYICPEPTCVHHDPTRALGDLTGIKKHFCRKHGEKKWKCDKCSKRYAVQSDWKAHSKTCGTREYRCDCGTLFSRRDSFITHRAFCDALAEDNTRSVTEKGGQGAGSQISSSPGKPNMNPSSISIHGRISSLLGESRLSSTWDQHSNINDSNSGPTRPGLSLLLGKDHPGIMGSNSHLQVNSLDMPSAFFHAQSTKAMLGSSDHEFDSQSGQKPLFPMPMTSQNSGSMYSNVFNPGFHGMSNAAASSCLQLSGISGASVDFGGDSNSGNNISIDGRGQQHSGSSHSAQMSATALLQKAAQMGATASNSPLLPGFGMAGSDSSTTAAGLRSCWQDSAHDQRREGLVSNLEQFHPFMKASMDNHITTNSLGSQFFTGSLQRSSDNASLQEIMNSQLQPTTPSGLYVSDNNIHPTFGSNGHNILDSTTNFSGNGSRIPAKDISIGGTQQGRLSCMGKGKLQDGGDKLTRDFLGVSGASRAMNLVGNHAGGMPRTFSDRDLVNIRSLQSSGMDVDSFNKNNQIDNLRSTGGNGQSPQNSWEVS
eukprot:Gb_24099 [translate_table: standard]